ncbi:MAG: hypothetical protein ACQKBT_07610 [Puniceicoccales bacterium]
MKTKTAALSIIAIATSAFSLSAADTVLFNDTVQNGGAFANGTIVIDSTFQYTNPDTSLTDTLKWTPDGDYKSGGLEFYGGKSFLVPEGVTNLEFTLYVDSTGSSLMNGFTVNLDTGSFDIGTDTWTLDGVSGAVGDFTGQTWHTIDVDLTSISGFDAGTSILNGLVAFKNNTDTSPVYIGDIRLTSSAIPESSAFAGIAGVMAIGFAVARRRRA